MEALKRHAGKFRDQVSKQQQAVKKHISGSGNESSDAMYDEVEMQTHQQLDKLCKSTKSKRDFQKEIIKAAEAFTAIAYKKIEAEFKLCDDCCKYGCENTEDDILGKAASIYGDALTHIEKQQEHLNKLIMSQVLDPLRSMVTNPALDEAHHLAQRYNRMRQEAEAQAVDVSKKNTRVVEAPSQENLAKLHAAVGKLQELNAAMAALGKDAYEALADADLEQGRLTFQGIVALVGGEKNYHSRVATLLGEVEAKLVAEKQGKEGSPPLYPAENTPKETYFLAEAIHDFVSESEKELSLAVGDHVIVRKVNPSGWSAGECKGKGGWFPSAYVEKRHGIPSGNSSKAN